MKNTMLKMIADMSKTVAVKAAGAASYHGYHQPKEPTILSSVTSEKDDENCSEND